MGSRGGSWAVWKARRGWTLKEQQSEAAFGPEMHKRLATTFEAGGSTGPPQLVLMGRRKGPSGVQMSSTAPPPSVIFQ